MAPSAPYTYYTCPCTDTTAPTHAFLELPEDDDTTTPTTLTFDPKSPRANYSLYPLENLLFCNECHEIRCPRCYFEEVLYYFCPQCLLETPSATVRGESNRCTRSCFQCPICVAPLSLQSFASSNADDPSRPKPDQPATRDGPFILACPYCQWSTLEIGIKLEKNINISGQLAQLKNPSPFPSGSEQASSNRAPQASRITSGSPLKIDTSTTPQRPPDQFTALTTFYKSELPENVARNSLALNMSTSGTPGGGPYGLDSPSHLARLLSTYGVGGLKKQTRKPAPMREAADRSEGLVPLDPQGIDDDEEIIHRMRTLGWDGATSIPQRQQQQHLPSSTTPEPPSQHTTRFPSNLRPTATPLLTKRAQRCTTCRHQLVRPDDKRQSTRYKIRLLALNYIPRLHVAPLDPPNTELGGSRALKASQFVLTFTNPLFDSIRLHLATPPAIGERGGSKVTILCPSFEVGASKDAWDEALDPGAGKDSTGNGIGASSNGNGVAEAGKVWEKGRNWTKVVLEVVPGMPVPRHGIASDKSDGHGDDAHDNGQTESGPDDEALEVPILIRTEYHTDGQDAITATGKGERVARELQFWVVVGLGKIAARS